MLGRTDSRPRSLLVLVLMAVFGIACLGRLGYWQFVRHDDLVARARDQVTARIEVPPVRGTIYDRSGTVVLATSVERDLLSAFPAQMTGSTDADTAALRERVASGLTAILGLTPADADALRAKLAEGSAYVVLAHGLTPAQSTAIKAGLADGSLVQLRLEPEPVRVYPLAGGATGTTLAAQLLGFVNRDGTGQYGIEGRWQDLLAGNPQVLLAQRDGSGRPILENAQTLQPGSPGTSVTLTIDASLQLKLEQEVYAAWVADHAKSVSGVVMDPRSGEILASATYPSYDGNDYGAIAARDPARFIDPIVSSVYEPGSVFKLLTATAALQAGVVTRSTRLSDQAVLRLDGGRAMVQNADRGSKGTLSFQDAVAWSRNVVMSKVALKLGSTTRQAATVLHDAWTRLGFGALTGIDVAGEVPGLVRDPAVQPWQQIDLANGAFGQGIAVTLLQLATAYSAMVNGGTLPTPHVVKETGDTPTTTADRGRVMTPALSADLTAIMERVVNVVPFYRARTLIPGYLVGGKTGTAQIWDSKTGSFRTDVYDFSFVGFVGRTAPELVVAVRITEGRPIVNVPGNMENAVESFELFRRIASDAMTTLDLPPIRPAPSPSAPAASARP
ncbi:MAG TPA: penicillin-binding protein 2 [Candidatus Limnocylindrales bacterium]